MYEILQIYTDSETGHNFTFWLLPPAIGEFIEFFPSEDLSRIYLHDMARAEKWVEYLRELWASGWKHNIPSRLTDKY